MLGAPLLQSCRELLLSEEHIWARGGVQRAQFPWSQTRTTWACHPQVEWNDMQTSRKWQECFSPAHHLAAFENQRLERFLPSATRAKQSCSIVAGRFVFAHFRQEERHSWGEETGRARARWEERKEPASGKEICHGFATFPSNSRPGESLAMSPLYQRSCMPCTSLAAVCLALFWV